MEDFKNFGIYKQEIINEKIVVMNPVPITKTKTSIILLKSDLQSDN